MNKKIGYEMEFLCVADTYKHRRFNGKFDQDIPLAAFKENHFSYGGMQFKKISHEFRQREDYLFDLIAVAEVVG